MAPSTTTRGVGLLDEEYLHHLGRGTELLAQGDHAGAVTALARARQLRPADARVLGLLGQAHYKLARFDDAAEAFEALVAGSPDEAGPRVNLGLAHLKARRFPDAIRHLEAALARQPGHERALGYLGVACLEQGDAARARECFQRAGNEPMVARCDELLAQAAAAAAAPTEAVATLPASEGLAVVPQLPATADVPFGLEHGFVVTRVAGEVLVRAEGLAGIRGQVRLSGAQEQQRGHATDRPFGGGGRRMLRASGTGAVLHSLPDRRVARLELDGARPACVCEPVVVAFEGSLSYENGRVASRLGTDLDLVQLRGRGQVLLATRGALVLVAVDPEAPVRVPVAALAGWIGALTPHFGPLVEPERAGRATPAPLAVELSGTGHVLVEGATE